MRTSWLLILFALPSLIGSVLLMRLVGVGQSLQVQQFVVASIGIAFALWMDKARRHQDAEIGSSMPQQVRNSVLLLVSMLLGLAACFAFSEAENPSRWLKLGGIRLYLSAAVLPMALYVFARLHWRLQFSAYANVVLMLAFAALLALQPDLSQLIAFDLAALFIVWHRAGGLVLKVGISVVLGLLCYWCWQQPDPLQPVPYVEGVIQLAKSAGIFAMLAAVVSVALIPIGLFYVGIKHNAPELMPIALYYIVIMICAYLGMTPMPLMGFGAGPVLGYFLSLGMRRNS
jgi:cell division protein FtsW (lipid II flippase)